MTTPRTPPAAVAAPMEHLERELIDLREQLQSTVEEYETALEELKSANEELQSVNEEMQSTNEELETSKEEIQSMNEELQTVNAQLTAKVDELDHANSDLRNLFESTQVATIFLDRYMVMRSFTPAVAGIYNLIPSRPRPAADRHRQPDRLRRPAARCPPRAGHAGAVRAAGHAAGRQCALPDAHPAVPHGRRPRGRRSGHLRRCHQHGAGRAASAADGGRTEPPGAQHADRGHFARHADVAPVEVAAGVL